MCDAELGGELALGQVERVAQRPQPAGFALSILSLASPRHVPTERIRASPVSFAYIRWLLTL
jgi:hypothetical protein